MAIIKFDNSEFLGLGIHYSGQQWTYAQVLELLDNYVSSTLEQLTQLAADLQIEPDAVILSTYTNKKDKSLWFNLPRFQLNKEGEFCLFIGEAEVKTIYDPEGENYIVPGQHFDVEIKRKDEKDSSSPITRILMVSKFARKVDGIKEVFELHIPVRTKKDSDLKAIAVALQNGETHEQIQQVGKGGGFSPFYKPFMLPKGFYRIAEVRDPKFLSTGGVIWEGYVTSLTDGQNYPVKMNTGPFVVQQRDTLLKQAGMGKPVYLYLNGAYNTAMGVAAIGHASVLPEIDGKVPTQIWSAFEADCKRITAATASKNSSKLLTDAQIQQEKETFEGNEAARIAEWQARKEASTAATPEPATVGATASTVDFDDDIPF